MIGFPLKVSLQKKCPTPFSNEPTTGGSRTPVLLATQYKLHRRVLGLKSRKVRPLKGLPSWPGNSVVHYVSIVSVSSRCFLLYVVGSNFVSCLLYLYTLCTSC